MKILHNSRCRKSREALQLLTDNKADFEVVEYLKEPISKDTLTGIIDALGVEPLSIIRKGEKVFKENYKGKEFSKEEWIDIMVENPILIERPIVFTSDKAVVGRPPENVLEMI